MHNVVTARLGRRYIDKPPNRNVDLTSLPVARIVLILKAELFLRSTAESVRVSARRQFVDDRIAWKSVFGCSSWINSSLN